MNPEELAFEKLAEERALEILEDLQKEALSTDLLARYAKKRGTDIGTAREMIQSGALSRMARRLGSRRQIAAIKTPEGRKLLKRTAAQGTKNLLKLGPEGSRQARSKFTESAYDRMSAAARRRSS